MASITPLLSSLLILSIISSSSAAAAQIRPKALVLPVKKDAATHQYVTTIKQRTPLVSVNLVVDLGGAFLWVDCDKGYVSSSYRPTRCGSVQCSLANSETCGGCYGTPRPNCNNDTCGLFPGNTVVAMSATGDLIEDVVVIRSTDGSSPGPFAVAPHFLFSCAPSFLRPGLALGSKGMAGFGRSNISLPTQLAKVFRFPRTFAVCLSSSTSSNGVIFLGAGPYSLLPGVDVSRSLIYTPLLINPVSTALVSSDGEASTEYFIGAKSIKVDGKTVKLNKTLLSIDKVGFGGTKISTVDKYTSLERTIYEAVTGLFIRAMAARKIERVAAEAPFEVCLSSKNVPSTRTGPAVPTIDLVLQSERVYWRIFGANSMVEVKEGVLCLGLLNGGVKPRTSIVIGVAQLEDNLLQFDLATSKLGFSSSLLFRQTTCANFNFTDIA